MLKYQRILVNSSIRSDVLVKELKVSEQTSATLNSFIRKNITKIGLYGGGHNLVVVLINLVEIVNRVLETDQA